MKNFLSVPLIALTLALPSGPAAHAAEAVPLDTLVQRIVSTHPELRFYEAELAAARSGVRAATARPDPELSLELGRRRVTDPGGTLAGEGAAWGVSVAQTFPWPGRLALRKAVANRDVALAELGLERFHAALSARAHTLAFGLHAGAVRAAATAEVATRFAALKEVFLARDPAGITPLLETRVIEAGELALQRRATEAALAAERARAELNQLRGEPTDAPLAVAVGNATFASPPEASALLAAAREKNFDYLARRLELEQQGYVVQLARHQRRPDVTVAPFYERARAGERETNYGVALSLSVPLGAGRRAEIDTAEARRQQAEVAATLAARELELEVLAAAREFAAKVAEVARWSPGAVARFREAAELADRHYRLGAVPLATYVELQTSYLDAVEALLDTQQEAVAAGLRLQELTGLTFNAVTFAP